MGKDKKAQTFELKKRYDAVYSENALKITNRHTKTINMDYDGNIIASRINSNKLICDYAVFQNI